MYRTNSLLEATKELGGTYAVEFPIGHRSLSADILISALKQGWIDSLDKINTLETRWKDYTKSDDYINQLYIMRNMIRAELYQEMEPMRAELGAEVLRYHKLCIKYNNGILDEE